jgi:hypothetical protein
MFNIKLKISWAYYYIILLPSVYNNRAFKAFVLTNVLSSSFGVPVSFLLFISAESVLRQLVFCC